MTKSKKIVSRMMFALLLLALVSCCFLGSTFARYTSTGSGTATVGVAKWMITGDFKEKPAEDGTATFVFDKLSPSMAEEIPAGEAARTNTTDRTLVLTIVNHSEVSAKITFTVGAIELDTTLTGDQLDNAKKPFSIALYDKDGTKVYDSKDTNPTAPVVTLTPGGTYFIYAEVTWTSDGLEGIETLAAADANDTMIGENVKSVKWTVDYTAVQASELPLDSTSGS